MERQFARIAQLVRRHRERTGRTPLSLFRGSREDGGAAPTRSTDLRCRGALGTAIAVDPTGQAWGCVMLAGTRPVLPARPGAALSLAASSPLWHFRLGDVRDEGFGARLASYARRVARARLFPERQHHHSDYGQCGTCRYLERCSLCPVAVAFGPVDADAHRVSSFVCAFTRVSQRSRERFSVMQTPASVLVRELRRCAERLRAEAPPA
jgi:hypothetical protein